MSANAVIFTVPGTPQGKGRPRAGKNKRGQTVIYTPGRTAAYENLIKACWFGAAHRKKAGKHPVQVDITAYFRPPERASRKLWEKLLANSWADRPTRKPDADNIVKAVLDALNKAAYDDDSQVTGISVCKLWGEVARLEIAVSWKADG